MVFWYVKDQIYFVTIKKKKEKKKVFDNKKIDMFFICLKNWKRLF